MSAETTEFTEALIPLYQISLDPAQPRRAMPEALRDDWISGIMPDEVLNAWETAAHAAAIDARMPLRWKHIINQENDPTPLNERGEWKTHDLPPVTAGWLELVRLAGSIHQAGLEQPVTVYPEDHDYRLIVGERRLLAFHLLNHMGYEGYKEIPAIKRGGADVWRQAYENSARENLNAISKARQLALLLMTLNPGQWETFEGTGQPDQAWYAQAHALRVPYGKAESVATALGLKHPRMVRHYRDLLSFPAEAWLLADEYNWSEGKLRGMIKAANGDSEQLLRIAREEAGLEPKIRKPSSAPSGNKTTAPIYRAIEKAEGLTPLELRQQIPADERAKLKARLLALADRL